MITWFWMGVFPLLSIPMPCWSECIIRGGEGGGLIQGTLWPQLWPGTSEHPVTGAVIAWFKRNHRTVRGGCESAIIAAYIFHKSDDSLLHACYILLSVSLVCACVFVLLPCNCRPGSDVNDTSEIPCSASKLWAGDNKDPQESNRLPWLRSWQMPSRSSFCGPCYPSLLDERWGEPGGWGSVPF